MHLSNKVLLECYELSIMLYGNFHPNEWSSDIVITDVYFEKMWYDNLMYDQIIFYMIKQHLLQLNKQS